MFYCQLTYLKKCRNRCLQNNSLCPIYYLNAPALACYMILSMTKVRLDLILDVCMYWFFEKRIRGGVSYISERYIKANNNYLASNDPKKNQQSILSNLTKMIYTVILCQNLFQRVYLSGWIMQNTTKINMRITGSRDCVLR